MKPDEIRKLAQREREATEQEARQTQQETRTDPDQARRLIKVIAALAVEDRDTALLLRMFLEGVLLKWVEEKAATDDAFALECAVLITDLMDTLKPSRVPRGKAAKSA